VRRGSEISQGPAGFTQAATASIWVSGRQVSSNRPVRRTRQCTPPVSAGPGDLLHTSAPRIRYLPSNPFQKNAISGRGPLWSAGFTVAGEEVFHPFLKLGFRHS
jgi:hypothetical protein